MLAKPYVTSPIVGATKPQHLDDALAALDVRLSTDEIDELEAPYVRTHRRVRVGPIQSGHPRQLSSALLALELPELKLAHVREPRLV